MGPTFLRDLLLFAQDKAAEQPAPGGPGHWIVPLLPWLAIGFLFYFLLIRPQRRQQAQRQAMLSAVKKNDRVITSGGIYGVVTNVHAEADEVTVKVDEATNTKLRITLGSVARVLGDETSDNKSK